MQRKHLVMLLKIRGGILSLENSIRRRFRCCRNSPIFLRSSRMVAVRYLLHRVSPKRAIIAPVTFSASVFSVASTFSSLACLCHLRPLNRQSPYLSRQMLHRRRAQHICFMHTEIRGGDHEVIDLLCAGVQHPHSCVKAHEVGDLITTTVRDKVFSGQHCTYLRIPLTTCTQDQKAEGENIVHRKRPSNCACAIVFNRVSGEIEVGKDRV